MVHIISKFYADASGQATSFDWASAPIIEPQAQSPTLLFSEPYPFESRYEDLAFSSQDSISTPDEALWQTKNSRNMNNDPPLPFLGHDVQPDSGSTNSTHCHWIGCKAKPTEFLTTAHLHHHTLTYHLQRCPWPSCNTRNAFRRRSDLNRHVESVHSGRRRFICNVPGCKRAFARSDKLTAHKKLHGLCRGPRKGEVNEERTRNLNSEDASNVVNWPQCASCTKMHKLQVVPSEVSLPFQPELHNKQWSGWSIPSYAPLQQYQQICQVNLPYQPELNDVVHHELWQSCNTMSHSQLQPDQDSQVANLNQDTAVMQQHQDFSPSLVYPETFLFSDTPSSHTHYNLDNDQGYQA
jgi:hypothetical protein